MERLPGRYADRRFAECLNRHASRERSAGRQPRCSSVEGGSRGGARQDNRKKARTKKRPCSCCGRLGHSEVDCWYKPEPPADKQFCSYCNLYNHSDDTCKYRLGHATVPLLRCTNCHKVGHNAQGCWQRPMHDPYDEGMLDADMGGSLPFS